MENNLKLYMVLLGCTPKGRLTEQHDVFFGIGTSVPELVRDMYVFWPDGGRLHADSWREVTHINGYAISIVPKSEAVATEEKLFFVNLGGYRPGEFEEYHYKTLIVAKSMNQAVKKAKKSIFFKHYTLGTEEGASHIDDKYALDVDDMHEVEDILAPHLKEKFSISISKTEGTNDELHIGYLKLEV